MQFGIIVQTKIDDWQLAVEAEALGFDSAWFPDTQMVWSDCYATMALAAHHTSRIRIGTGVAIPGTRIAPVTAHSIASINELAPGRTFLGIGTGHTAMRAMGQNPMRLAPFEEYLRVVRALLAGDEVDFRFEGKTRNIQFLHEGMGFRNTEAPVPIYVAANGPKTLQLTGRCGDGLITLMGESQDMLAYNLGMIGEGARAAGRALPEDFHTTALVSPVILRAGETLRSDRVIDVAAPYAVCMLHYVYEVYERSQDEEVVPEFLRGVWDGYCEHVAGMSLPPEKRFRQIHDGHATYCPPKERRFVTPEVIEGTCLVGSESEIADALRKAEASGLREACIVGPLAQYREVMNDFAAILRRD